MDDVHTLLEEQLRDEAPPSRISVSRAIADGRQAIRFRRVAVPLSAALAVTLAVLSVVWLSRPAHPGHPVPVGTLSASPAPSLPVPVRPGLPVLTGAGIAGGPATIMLPNGGTVTLPTPPGTDIDTAVEVPGGWVYDETTGEGTQNPTMSVWFMPTGGTPHRISDEFGNFLVSNDGTVVVIAGARRSAPTDSVIAYALPSLHEIRRTTFNAVLGPVVTDLNGDWALLAGANGSPAPSPAELWNVRTGQTVPFVDKVNTWPMGVSRDGRVLRRVDRTSGAKSVVRSCYDMVTPGATVPTGLTGYCKPSDNQLWEPARLSPSGTWAAFILDHIEVVRTTDLHQGRWLPTRAALDGQVLMWDSDSTFIVQRAGFARCDVTGACTPLAIPEGGRPLLVVGG